jgi:hypothetical protein
VGVVEVWALVGAGPAGLLQQLIGVELERISDRAQHLERRLVESSFDLAEVGVRHAGQARHVAQRQSRELPLPTDECAEGVHLNCPRIGCFAFMIARPVLAHTSIVRAAQGAQVHSGRVPINLVTKGPELPTRGAAGCLNRGRRP